VLDVDAVIFCIGDQVDNTVGLPVRNNEFTKNPQPRFPVDGLSYETYNPDLERPIERVFVAGWSREASHGLVGVARKDGENGADAILAYLHTLPGLINREDILENLSQRLAQVGKPVITKEALNKLDEAERAEAQRLGVEDFKYGSNQEMLSVITGVPTA
jgi:ferredoxin--NADP+ reductase